MSRVLKLKALLKVEHWIGKGDRSDFIESNQTLNCNKRINSKQRVGEKVHSQEGNSPDYKLRSITFSKLKRRI